MSYVPPNEIRRNNHSAIMGSGSGMGPMSSLMSPLISPHPEM